MVVRGSDVLWRSQTRRRHEQRMTLNGRDLKKKDQLSSHPLRASSKTATNLSESVTSEGSRGLRGVERRGVLAGVASGLNVALRGVWKWAISRTSGGTPWGAKRKKDKRGECQKCGSACVGDAVSLRSDDAVARTEERVYCRCVFTTKVNPRSGPHDGGNHTGKDETSWTVRTKGGH